MDNNEAMEKANEIIKTEEKIPLHKKVWNGIKAIPKKIDNFAHEHPWITAGAAAVGGAAATVGTAIAVNKFVEKQNRESEEIIDELREDGFNIDDDGRPIVEDIDTNVDVG